ncbi:phosphotransferase [Sphingobium sp. ba1]|uniref:phosphotransferase n=1 Tax=Sphingobium sp. ba1 TaxID=1522072 RepID=UPI000559E90C|nr:phosphotransferase [Sphingobium sp. ba1]
MSAAGQDANLGTTPVRAGYEFDELSLARWMECNIDGFVGPLSVEQFKGGQSNPTYKLSAASGSYVLRRKPPGQLLKGAHAIEREARVLQALGGAGFPVARVHGICTDEAIIGTWFYVMDMVEGRIFWDATIPEVDAADRPAYFDAMNATIAHLHLLDADTIGLGDYGRPGNYFARQISRWSQQYLDDRDAGRDSNMDRLVEWLPANIPVDENEEVSVVHGDFRIDNMIFHPTEPRVVAVLDWELSTLGHPLADFAYHAMMYHMPSHIVAGLADADLGTLNIPSEDAYIEAYCRRTGRAEIPGYRFALAFNFFRLAAIFHGIKGRAIRGTAASAQAQERAAAFPELAALAVAQISGGS